MAYGTIKVDTITFTNAGVDKSVTISGLVQNPTFSGNVTVTGTVSGATITGGIAAFTTITGGVATITSGVFATGNTTNPSISFSGDSDTGIHSPSANQLAITTSGVERVEWGPSEVVFNDDGVNYDFRIEGDTNANLFFVDASADRVGIGTSSPGGRLDVQGGDVYLGKTVQGDIFFSDGNDTYVKGANNIFFQTPNGSNRITVKGDTGNVGIGTTSPTHSLDINSAIRLRGAGASTEEGDLHLYYVSDSNRATITSSTNGAIVFENGIGAVFERARIDSSGRLLVGTSSSSAVDKLQVVGSTLGTGYQGSIFLKNGLAVADMLADYDLGVVKFGAGAEALGATITATAESNWTTAGSGDYPTRLVFSTTADGASSPATERMRISNNGYSKHANAGSGAYDDATGAYHELVSDGADNAVRIKNTNATPFGLRITHTTDSNATGNEFIACFGAATIRAAIRSNGGLANYSANNANLSDRNAKKDISPAAGTWDCIKEWEIVNYRYKDQPDDAGLNLGVIAQQVAESCPEVITVFQEAKEATEDAPAQEERLGVKEQQMYWMAIKALQEAQARIEQLEQRLTDAGIA